MAMTKSDTVNYTGELFLIGAYQTPFLNMVGGLDGARAKLTRSFIFPVAQPYSLTGASQPAITEDTSVGTQTATTVSRTQDYNTVQIFQECVEVSYKKQSSIGELSGYDPTNSNKVTDETAFQKAAALRQIAIDCDTSMLNGAYQAAATTGTAAQMQGIITACASNTVDAGSAALSKAYINELLREMAASGAIFEDMVIFCNAFQRQKISDIYGNAIMSTNVGGVAVSTLLTDFCQARVVYAPNVPAATLLIADMSVCYPVFCPVPGKGLLFYEDLPQAGASWKGQFYGQIGLDYGPEEYHGTLTSLSTS